MRKLIQNVQMLNNEGELIVGDVRITKMTKLQK